ncbi:hypothetical protein ACQ5SK_37155 [Bradyrhizobium japonicum]
MNNFVDVAPDSTLIFAASIGRISLNHLSKQIFPRIWRSALARCCANFQHNNPLVTPNGTEIPASNVNIRSPRWDARSVVGRSDLQVTGGFQHRQGNIIGNITLRCGRGLNSQGNFAPAEAGFDLADVSYVDQVNALPDGVQGLVWLNQYQGVTQDFIDQVTPFLDNPKVFGFYLVDEPDMTGQWGPQADPADLKAESDWIHQHDPNLKTFTVLMNMGSADDPNYMNSYNQANTHIDYFGLDWYPVWEDRPNVDLSTIDKYVAAAEQAGIPLNSIVPVYQTFGGGDWITENGTHHVLPTAQQEQAMIDHWAELVPNPAFDYAYAWGSQEGDTALEDSPELQQVFLAHNTSHGTGARPLRPLPILLPIR